MDFPSEGVLLLSGYCALACFPMGNSLGISKNEWKEKNNPLVSLKPLSWGACRASDSGFDLCDSLVSEMGILPSRGMPEKLDDHRRLQKTIHHIWFLQIHSDGQMTSRWSTALTPMRKCMTSPQNLSEPTLRLGRDCGYPMPSASSEVRISPEQYGSWPFPCVLALGTRGKTSTPHTQLPFLRKLWGAVGSLLSLLLSKPEKLRVFLSWVFQTHFETSTSP